MMYRARRLSLRHAAIACVLLLAAAGVAAPAAAQFALSQVPSLVSAPPPTNLVLTIDDSGSMQNAFVPDSVGGSSINVTLAYTSSDYNRLYYNPTITYTIPPNAAGLQASSPSAATNFTAAYLDGFNPAAGTVDLSRAYAPTLTYQPGATSANVAVPDQPVGNVAYYYTYTGGTGCFTPVAWNAPPPDSCFTQTVVRGNNGPAFPGQAAGWDERQNFATWYSFYRTRHLAIASSAAIAMSDQGLASVRVAWQGLTTCNDFTSGLCQGWQSSAPSVDNRLHTFIDTSTSTHRSDFFSWLFRVPAANSTPTRLAWSRTGNYFMQSVATYGQNSAYVLDPNDGSTDNQEFACVNNFQITMTDGQWNTFQEGGATSFCGGNNCGNADATPTTFPDGISYAPSTTTASSTSIYSDDNTDGLADIAFYYWKTNLRPDLAMLNVKPYLSDPSTANPITGQSNDQNWPYWNPRNDPATWPHMVNFTIGVGLTAYLTLPGLNWYQDSFGALPPGSTSLNLNGYSNLLSLAQVCSSAANEPNAPYCNWPNISPNGSGGSTFGGAQSAGGNPGNVYDLWHAAIDSRGQAFSAESPLDLVTSLKAIINRIEGQATGTGTAAGSTSALADSTMLFVGTFAATDWHGTLSAYAVDGPRTATPGDVATTPTWTTDTPGSIPPVASRNVYTSLTSVPVAGSGATAMLAPTPFNSSDSALQASALWPLLASGPTAADQVSVVKFLLGDASNETPNGLLYRSRPVSKLGDIVDSTPTFTSNENLGYQVLETGTNPEAAASYLTYVSTTKTSRPAMVYVGANDGMLHGFDATAGSSSTVERLAYVPHSVVPNLSRLTNIGYAHRYYVDSTPYVGDAFLNGSWKTVVVGATGAGGKGVFALDVTQPQSFNAANVLWDMDGTGIVSGSTNYGNGDPDLGYTIGQPVVVRANDGHWYAAFGNGYLSTNACPVLYLVRLDNGNLSQKINPISGPTTPCTTANGLGAVTPLDIDGNGTTDFIYAGDLLGNLWKFDLTSSVNTAWTVSQNGGQTAPGPLFVAETGATTPVLQSIVGAPSLGPAPNGVMVYFSTGHFFASNDISDTHTQSVYGIQDSGVAVTRSTLVQQTVTTDSSGNFRTVSQNLVSLTGGNNGWVIDFPGSGERAVQQPFLVDNVIVFVSQIPGAVCSGGCTSFLFGLNALSGGGGVDFLSSNGTYYDAIAASAGCLTGLTPIVGSGSSVFIYGFSQNFGGGGNNGTGTTGSSGSGSGSSSGSTGTGSSGAGTTAKLNCPPNVECQQGTLNNSAHRVSWHEMVQ